MDRNMLTSTVRAGITPALLPLFGVAAEQSAMTAQNIKDSEIPGIIITPYDAAGLAPELDPLTRGIPGVTRLRPYSVVIVNRTTKPIVGIALRWTWRDSAGQPRVHDLRSDGLFLVRHELLSPNGKILVAPGTVLPVGAARTGYTQAWNTPGSQIKQLEQTSGEITVALDTVVFADGEVAGPDESRTLQYIQARAAAAQSLGRSVLKLLQQGKDPSAYLSQIKSQGYSSRGDYFSLWTFRLTDHLLAARDRKQCAEELLGIPILTLFRR